MKGRAFRWALALLASLLALAPFGPGSRCLADTPQPILRIETGMHLAAIKGLAADAAGRLLVTSSDDRTLRLWSLPGGELIRVLRPPIDVDHEGKVYTVAVSPDGRQIIAGGYLGVQFWGLAYSLYVFDTETGAVVHRIGGLPQVAQRLAWSADGRYVAVILGDGHGVRVYRTVDWTEIMKDADFADDAYGLSFDPAGNLAASGYDGFVRLYDRDFNKIAKVAAPSGKRLGSVVFSPDGKRLALGYYNPTAVDILSVPALERLFAADTREIVDGVLTSVAWTNRGSVLAGGFYSAADSHKILRWEDGGSGPREEFDGGGNTIMEITPLADGGWAYATADPAFGVYSPDGVRVFERHTGKPIFLNQRNILRVSEDGRTVAFGFAAYGKRPAWFSVDNRQLTLADGPADLKFADTGGLAVADWENHLAPKLAGKPLQLEPYETSECLAVASDRKSFLLGSTWYLHRFDADGSESWSVPLPEAAWAVNLSGDGRLAIAAIGDGTIRWYRYSDGAELLALFALSPDRWVLWTPGGDYDVSSAGEALVGWHVNRSIDEAADFYPASQFRDRFYRPWTVATGLYATAERRN